MASRELSLDGRRVWIAGHRGMVGAALMRRMAGEGAVLLTVPHAQLDLRRQSETEDWLIRYDLTNSGRSRTAPRSPPQPTAGFRIMAGSGTFHLARPNSSSVVPFCQEIDRPRTNARCGTVG